MRPEITTDTTFHVDQGRHPVIDALNEGFHVTFLGTILKVLFLGSFVPNDCDLSVSRQWILSGANMVPPSTLISPKKCQLRRF